MTIIYHYHPNTGEYVAIGEADQDPLNAGNWLIPAYATTIAPPEADEGFVAVFEENDWKLLEDFRGKCVFDKNTGESLVIKNLGPISEEYTLLEKPSDEYKWEVDKWVVDSEKANLKLSNTERAWRDAELNRADIELNKVQDGVGTGTVTQWREYRCALRDWPENELFPDASKRPIAPDAQ